MGPPPGDEMLRKCVGPWDQPFLLDGNTWSAEPASKLGLQARVSTTTCVPGSRLTKRTVTLVGSGPVVCSISLGHRPSHAFFHSAPDAAGMLRAWDSSYA